MRTRGSTGRQNKSTWQALAKARRADAHNYIVERGVSACAQAWERALLLLAAVAAGTIRNCCRGRQAAWRETSGAAVTVILAAAAQLSRGGTAW